MSLYCLRRNIKKSCYCALLVSLFLMVFFSLAVAQPKQKAKEKKERILIMKEFTVEGEFDRPAIIIVPKAKLMDGEMFPKSFYNDIVKSIYIRPFKDFRNRKSVMDRNK